MEDNTKPQTGFDVSLNKISKKEKKKKKRKNKGIQDPYCNFSVYDVLIIKNNG